MTTKKKPLSGAARAKLAGRKNILIDVPEEVHDRIREAAASNRRNIRQFVLYCVEKEMEKMDKNKK